MVMSSKNPYLELSPPTKKSNTKGLFPISSLISNPDIMLSSDISDNLYFEANRKESSIPSVRDIIIPKREEISIVKSRKRKRRKVMSFSGRKDPSKSSIFIVEDNDLELLRNSYIYVYTSSRAGGIKILPKDVLASEKERIYKRTKRATKKKLTAESSRLSYPLIDGNVYSSSSACGSL